jgi:3-oxoadipate enol-lactonase
MSFVTVDGVRLHYRIDGPADAPLVVFLNALGTDLGMWNPQIAAFASNYRVVRHDFRGQGGSDSPAGPYTIELLGADTLGFFDELGIERAYVCGSSTGGMVAQWLAALHPERVQRAVFVSTAARIGSAQLWNDRAEAVTSGGMAAVAEMVIRRLVTDSFQSRDPEAAEAVAATLTSCPPEGYTAICLALRDGDLAAVVAKISSPSLIVVGADDVATPPSDARWLHEHIAGSELVVLDDASHLCNIEQPARFNEVVLEFLAGGDRGGRRA